MVHGLAAMVGHLESPKEVCRQGWMAALQQGTGAHTASGSQLPFALASVANLQYKTQEEGSKVPPTIRKILTEEVAVIGGTKKLEAQ